MYTKGVRNLALGALFASLICGAASAQTVYSGTGLTGSTNALNDFRTAIGGGNNGVNPPPAIGGRREVNWDGVKLDGTDFGGNTTVIDLNHTVGIPVNRFQARGTSYTDVFAVSKDGFASVNPGTAGEFNAFSPKNTFASFNTNTIGVNFVLASLPTSTPVPASTRGFGAIFLDVEKANSSGIEFFHNSTSLGKWFVTPSNSGDPEFLGVLFDNPLVTSVDLFVGTDPLFHFDGTTVTPGGPEDLANGKDLAAVDDFVYAEPVLTPEPSSCLLFATGGIALFVPALRRRYTRSRKPASSP